MLDSGFESMSFRDVKRFEIDTSAENTDVIEAVEGKAIRILHMVLSVSGAATLIFLSDQTEIGKLTFKAADPPMVLDRSQDGWLQTASAEKFTLNNADGATVRGFGTYIEK